MSKFKPFTALIGGGTGSLDKIPVADISDGDVAYGIVSGLYHPYTYDAASTASESSPYVIIPNDNVSGTGAWVLGGFQGAISHVRATTNAEQSISSGAWNTVIYGTEEEDLLLEYDNTTGIFAPKNTGIYIITSNIHYASSSVWIPSAVYLKILKDSTDIKLSYKNARAGTYRIEAKVTDIIPLTSSETIKIQTLQDSGGARVLDVNPAYNTLAIGRLI